MIKKIIFNLFMVVITLIVILLITEVSFRLFSKVTGVYYPAAASSPAIFVDSPEGYSLLPNSNAKHYSLYGDYVARYAINSAGFRVNYDYPTRESKNSKKIFILGDSFVFGIGVNNDQTLAAYLERKLLNSGLADRYDVLNLGVTGYTFDNSYVRFKKYAVASPSIVIFVVFGANDFSDILAHEWVRDNNKDIIKVKESARHVDPHNRFVNGPQSLYKKENIFLENIREFLRNHSVFYTYLGTLRHRNIAKVKTNEDNVADDSRGLIKAKQVLDQFFVSANNNKFKALFILVGFSNKQIKEEFIHYLTGKTNFVMDLNDLGLNRSLYLPRDGHWSAYGNSYIADLIFNYLRNNNLL